MKALLCALLCAAIPCSAQFGNLSPEYVSAFLSRAAASGGGGNTAPTVPTVLQHVATSVTLGGGMGNNTTMKVQLPEYTGASNAVLIALQGGSASINFSVGFLEAATRFTKICTNGDSGQAQGMLVLLATNVPAGCRTFLITNNTGVLMQYVSVAASEIYGVAQAGALDVVASTNRTQVTAATAGLTPSQTGDLIWQYYIDDSGSLAHTNFTTTNQSANIDWKLLNTDRQDGTASQYGVYNSTATLNPTLIAGQSTKYISCAVALKAQTGMGTWRPNRPYIAGLHHLSQAAINNSFVATETSLTNVIQVPTVGNFFLMSLAGAGDMFVTNSKSVSGVTWTEAAGGPNRQSTNHESTQFIYALNAAPGSASNSFTVTNYWKNTTNGAVGADSTIMFYDVVNASTLTYESRSSASNDQTVASGLLTAPPSLTPSVAGGLLFAVEQHEFNTATNITTMLFDANFYDDMNLDGPQNMDQNGGWGHLYVTNTSAVTFPWQFKSSASALRTYAADAIYFKP